MTRTTKELAWRLPDGIVHDEYLNPEFWLSGQYADFATDTVRFVPIGEHATHWIYTICDEDPLNFAALMADTTGIGLMKFDMNHVRNGMPSGIFFLKGTTEWAMDLPPDDPKYLSPEAREEMSAFAQNYPYLLDVLRLMSREDFQSVRSDALLTPTQLVMYRRMPGPRFLYWQKCFPWLLDSVYSDIQTDEDGKVIRYKVQPISQDLADFLGVPTDPFEGMEE